MQWTKKDIQTYLGSKEYIDTAIIPIIPFQLSRESEIGKSTSKREILSIFATEIEKELSGRVLLVPNYYYLEFGDKEAEAKRLNDWTKELFTQPFKHVFILTFDSGWKRHEKELDANLLWLPGFQVEDPNSVETIQMIRGQVADVVELMRSYW
ncbi:YpiF family protein [Ornithinibacillus scapharcae]|uniref:YpiF family protein n=1 Tax=Ornithinibacillus scapharcae TaxID=1147159 RepID=UPI000225BA2E|nr:YpiF family protein [Ornithinibacillus scapharcae]